jgi:tRNA-dihydrouridine synthase
MLPSLWRESARDVSRGALAQRDLGSMRLKSLDPSLCSGHVACMRNSLSLFSRQRLPGRSVVWGVAPMEGVTELPFRLWLSAISKPTFMWTPFLRVTDTFPGKSLPESFIPELSGKMDAAPYALFPQLMGSRPEEIVRAAQLFVEGSAHVDLNCGCPSPTVVGNKSGSSLLRSADEFRSFISHCVSELGPGVLSVKMRLGYDSASEFVTLIDAIEDQPLKFLTVHGRSRPQKYTGLADYSAIEYAAKRLHGRTPVIASGDVIGSTSKTKILTECPSISAVIVGRGAIRNPSIFDGNEDLPILKVLELYARMQLTWLRTKEALYEWKYPKHHSLNDRLDASILWLKKQNDLDFAFQEELSNQNSRVLARTKMIWNYMRSSLDPVFFDGLILRSKTLQEFFELISIKIKQTPFSDGVMPLIENDHYNWLYSGEKNPNPR